MAIQHFFFAKYQTQWKTCHGAKPVIVTLKTKTAMKDKGKEE